MKMNFKGLVDLHTLPKTTPLLPLYEAIINSIQSIEDAQISNGKIEIIILLILMLVNIRFKRVVKVLGECCG